MKRALVTGIISQDGSHLAELLPSRRIVQLAVELVGLDWERSGTTFRELVSLILRADLEAAGVGDAMVPTATVTPQ